ncbi:PQQ-binding-like beta-propeller repeat protein [Verrucomicrobiota bacterium]
MKKIVLYVLTLFFLFSAYAQNADDIIKAAGVKGGLVVCIGSGNPKFIAELRPDEKYIVHCLDTDQKNIASARKYIQAKGLYGKVTVSQFDGEHLPYIDNLVNLVIYEEVSGVSVQVSAEEIERVLAPRGVVLIKGNLKPRNKSGAKAPETCNLKPQSPAELKEWTKLTKPVPPEIDDWTHWLHGPDNNAVANDTVIDVARNIQWAQAPTWVASHNLNPAVSAMVSAKGKVFSIINEMPPGIKTLDDQWILTARDAFNGLVLWKRSISEWGWKLWSKNEHNIGMRFANPFQVARRLIAVGDRVFVTPGFYSPVHAVDAVTGKDLKIYKGTEKAFEILFADGVLMLAVNHALGTDKDSPDISIMCVNPETGEVLWKNDGLHGVQRQPKSKNNLANVFMTVGSGKVYLVDKNQIVCFDLAKGNELWRADRPEKVGASADKKKNWSKYYPNYCTLVHSEGVVLLSEVKDDYDRNCKTKMDRTIYVVAYDSTSGKEMWKVDGLTWAHGTPPDLFVVDGLVWTLEGDKRENILYVGLDLKTGKQMEAYPAGDLFWGSGHQRCFRSKATKNFLTFSRRNTEYLNLKTGEVTEQSWLKGMCGYGVMPANGMIYYPPHNCACYISSQLTGFKAVTAVPYPKIENKTTLIKGSAYGKNPKSEIRNPQSSWPMYRHDPERSGSTSSVLPTNLSRKWEVGLDGDLTQAIAVKNKVYIADKNAHEIYCLDRGTGKTVWRYTADGRIDSSPTYSNGRLVFGSRDGYVYCLNAETGELAWRFRAAPYDVKIVSYDQLESLWPVHGSLIVQNAKIYCLTGRSSHLNGGMYLYVLNLESGEVIQKQQIKGDVKSRYESKNSVLSDLMTAVGDKIYMRTLGFDADDINKSDYAGGSKHHTLTVATSGIRAGGGLLDSSWFNTSVWSYGSWKGESLAYDKSGLTGISGHQRFGQSCGHDVFVPGQTGYLLFYKELSEKGALPDAGKLKGVDRNMCSWSTDIPLRGQSLLLANNALYIAGSKDVVGKEDPWEHIEGRAGGVLAVYSREDGKKLSELPLSSAPIFDGLSACGNNLFLVTKDGTVICYE